LSRVLSFFYSAIVVCVLLAFVFWPQIDLVVSGFFASPDQGFYLRDNRFLNGMTKAVFICARLMLGLFGLCAIVAYGRKKPWLGLSAKAWCFLFLGLLIGPGLLANVVFKDHWGRARPRSVELFGGAQAFTPAGVISDACHRNCSFVSGDAAFGFFLPSFAYVVPARRRRQVFWSGMGLGAVLSGARILLGAHFLSDVLYAMVLVLITSAGLHALLYTKEETRRCWNEWLPFMVNRR